MKRRLTLLAIATFFSTSLMAQWDGITTTAPSSGSGSAGDPYLIETEANLAWIASNSSKWNLHYRQTNDLDLGNHPWTPIGNSTTKFTGSFDGNGFVINNLYYNNPAGTYVGLFGRMNTSATLKNITLASGFVSGNQNTGGICGCAEGNSKIICCDNIASVY